THLGPPDPELVAKVEAKHATPITPESPAVAVDDQLAPESDRAQLVRYVKVLPPAALQRARGWTAEAKRHDTPWGSIAAGKMTRRTYAINEAAAACAEHLTDHDLDPDDLTRAALAVVQGEDVQPEVPTGAALGALSID